MPAQSVVGHEVGNVWAIGDSLTAATYPAQLAKLSRRQVANWGVVGQMSSEIAARVGASPSFFTVMDATVPAAGEVKVTPTAATADLLRTGDRQQLSGMLEGIPGTLSRSGTYDLNAGTYTFTRSQSGKAVRISNEVNFVPDVGSLPQRIMVVWVGRNNYGDLEGILNNIDLILKNRNLSKRFIILSVLNADTLRERKTDQPRPTYDAIIKLNMSLEKIYPNNFIDIRKILSQNTKGDFPPIKYRRDELHLNEFGDQVVANEVYKFIVRKNW